VKTPPLSPPDPHHVAALEAAVTLHGQTPGGLLPALHEIQDRLGFVPPFVVATLAETFALSRADVEGVISFYHDFRSTPPGRHQVKLCRGEACQAMGANALIASVEQDAGCSLGATTRDGNATLDAVYCLGNCALAPAALVDGKLVGRVTPARVATLIGGKP
jgi:formate dehydrogenase subunit gamma